jgi:YD repeat-containing protein
LPRQVTYGYDADGNRASITYPTPDSFVFNYTYTNRNQLASVVGWANYVYDLRGNLFTRTVVPNGNTVSTYQYDIRDRPTWITHALNGGMTRQFSYGYCTNSDNRKYTKRTWTGLGDVFNYDLADEATGVALDVSSPNTTPTPAPNITYDGNGNRIFFSAYDSSDTYTTDSLNQYTVRQSVQMNLRPTPTPRGTPTPPPRPGEQDATYDYTGNMSTGFDGSTYIHDAQNRLLSATTNGVTMYFDYDGLNRQVSRRIGATGARTFSVWDGWDLIDEYQAGGATTAAYLYGAGGLIANSFAGNPQFNYYYQDASGSTSNIADNDGILQEWYRYDLDGTPFIYDIANNQLGASAFGVRHLFTG